MIRFAFTTVTLAAVLAATGCGGAAGDRPAAAPRPQAPAPVDPRHLTPAQYVALEDAYEAEVAFDKLEKGADAPSFARADAVARPIVGACRKLDARHPLLHALRDACVDRVDVFMARVGVARCRTIDACRPPIDDERAAAHQLATSSRAADRAIAATAIPAGCKRALRTPRPVYVFYRRLDARLEQLADALAFGFETDLQQALIALGRLDRSGLPSRRESLKRFRAGCR